jgi:hypothetical protein
MKIEKNYIKISSLILIKTPVKNISYIPVWMLFQVIPPRAVHCPVRRTRGTGRGVCANGGCVELERERMERKRERDYLIR